MKIEAVKLARLCNVSRQAVHNAKQKGIIKADAHGLFSLADPDVMQFIREHVADASVIRGLFSPRKSDDAPPPDFTTMTGLSESVADMTLNEFILSGEAARHGRAGLFWTKLHSKLQSAQKSAIDFQSRRAQLVERSIVTDSIDSYIDHLADGLDTLPDMLTEVLVGAVQRDEKAARLQVPEKMRKDFSRVIREAKSAVRGELKPVK